MDTSIFLGGKEPTTLKELAAVLGKETIDTYNTGESRGTGDLPLAQLSEIGERADEPGRAGSYGWRQVHPPAARCASVSFRTSTTSPEHPNFKYTADADDKRTTFDIEAFLSARLKLKPDEVCDVYEVDTEGAVITVPLEKGVIVSIRRNLPSVEAIGVQSGQSSRQNNEKGGQPESGPRIDRAADCSGFCAPMKHDQTYSFNHDSG